MLRLLHTSRCGRPRATAAVMCYESEDGLSGELLGIMIICLHDYEPRSLKKVVDASRTSALNSTDPTLLAKQQTPVVKEFTAFSKTTTLGLSSCFVSINNLHWCASFFRLKISALLQVTCNYPNLKDRGPDTDHLKCAIVTYLELDARCVVHTQCCYCPHRLFMHTSNVLAAKTSPLLNYRPQPKLLSPQQ